MLPEKVKGYDLSIEILNFCAEEPRKYGEILKLNEKLGVHQETVKRRIKKLKKYGYLVQDEETKKYSPYGNIEFPEGNIIEQIEKIKIGEKILNGLWNQLKVSGHNKIGFNYRFDNEIHDKFVFSDSIRKEVFNLLFDLIFECVILNPDNFILINKPEHLNFQINFKSKLGTDPEIFEIIKKIRKKIKLEKSWEDLYNKAFKEHYTFKKEINEIKKRIKKE